MSGDSVVFDRAAEVYDRTRALPPRVLEAVVRVLCAEVAGRGRVLEAGVGTGRIAVPLAGVGVPVFGVDLSAAMLGKLREKERLVPVAVADATELPFPDSSFGGSLVCHVLHLVSGWRRAVDELVRVVRPGGVVLADAGGPPNPVAAEIERRIMSETGMTRRHPGLQGTDGLDEAMAAHGASLRLLEPIALPVTFSIELWLRAVEENVYSWTWPLDDDARRRAATVAREWATECFGPLDAPIAAERRIAWRAYDLP